MSENQRRPVRMHGPGARMGGEKAKDFKGTIKKLVNIWQLLARICCRIIFCDRQYRIRDHRTQDFRKGYDGAV